MTWLTKHGRCQCQILRLLSSGAEITRSVMRLEGTSLSWDLSRCHQRPIRHWIHQHQWCAWHACGIGMCTFNDSGAVLVDAPGFPLSDGLYYLLFPSVLDFLWVVLFCLAFVTYWHILFDISYVLDYSATVLLALYSLWSPEKYSFSFLPFMRWCVPCGDECKYTHTYTPDCVCGGVWGVRAIKLLWISTE